MVSLVVWPNSYYHCSSFVEQCRCCKADALCDFFSNVFNKDTDSNFIILGSKKSQYPVSYTHLTLPTKRIV